MSVNEEQAVPNEGELYPKGLIEWAGHRNGGVRKPFRQTSGRPTGARIETPLVTRLRKWLIGLASCNQSLPTTVLLVGGPGNGKTDAIESCIEFLDEATGAQGELYKAFASSFDLPNETLPPRKVTIDLVSLGVTPPNTCKRIALVQDATEEDVSCQHKPEELLLDELLERLNPSAEGIYLCCVNRGILAHASTLAHERTSDSNAASLMNAITAAVTSDPDAPSCWPLDGFDSFAVWPMDVESLVERTSTTDGRTVAHQIFSAALNEAHWVPTCSSGPRCPFCANRKLLSKSESLDSLIDLLRYYELASGKRWTFRDLFSLVPYILVGDYEELTIKGKPVSPCEWSALQNNLIKNGKSGDPERARAPYLLVSRLYYHRLFPRWPSLDKGGLRRAKSILSTSFLPGLDTAQEFFRYLAYFGGHARKNTDEISTRLFGSFGELLDPALAAGDSLILTKSGADISVNQIEELISLSLSESYSLVKDHIEPLERDLLKLLVKADDALVEDNFPRTKAQNAKQLQAALRQFGSRLIKRSLGARRGIGLDHIYYVAYRNALVDPRLLTEVRKQLRKLLHDGNNRFRASLVTTFGQPVAQRSRDVALLTRTVTIKEYPVRNAGIRPPAPMPYLKVDKSTVPLTFPLYKALSEVAAGLHDASLPEEIFALLNGIRSLVSGHVVRDKTILEEDAFIELGNSVLIGISNNEFYVLENNTQ